MGDVNDGAFKGSDMWRYLLPAVLLMSALLVLFAGALGDVGSWQNLQAMVMSVVERPVDQPSPPKPTLPASAGPPAKPADPADQAAPDAAALRESRDALQTQVTNLQQDVAQQRQELASLHANEDQEQRAIDALRKQRHDFEAASARPAPARQYNSTGSLVIQSTPSESAPSTPRSNTTTRQPSSTPPAVRLMAARQALTGGRPEDARRMLALAQTEMVFQPVTPDQPDASGGNMAATEVGYAIRWLDLGNPDMAVRQIDAVLATMPTSDATGAPSDEAPTPLASGYAAPRPATANGGSPWR
jgi:hypothetical protein